MKKVISIILVAILLVTGLFVLTGCDDNGGSNVKTMPANSTEISYVNGKGVFKLWVPKKDDGTPKYEFTKEKPAEISSSATFYLVTDTAVFGFSTSGLAYNTGKEYKEKYGNTVATFDGYLAFLDDTTLQSRAKLAGDERFELNGRKAERHYNRAGGSGDYEYYGYFYLIGVDDIYPGSRVQMTVNYKTTERPKEAKEFDQETLDIINSLRIELVQQ